MADQAQYTAEQRKLLPQGHQGRFTAEELEDWKRDEIMALSRSGTRVNDIAKELGVSSHTVMAVRQQAGFDWKQATIAALEQGVPVGAARLADAFAVMDVKKLPIAWAIATDKLLLLKGEATSHVQVTHQIDLSQIKYQLQDCVEAEVVDPDTSTNTSTMATVPAQKLS